MTVPTSPGLTRLTIAAGGQLIDVALPDNAPLAGLLPLLLDEIDDGLRASAPEATGGWSLCRPDGSRLATGRSLAALQVRDGEVLHLRPRDLDWPEPRYDDMVLSIAEATNRLGGRWRPAHTRVAGLAVAGATLLVGLIALLTSGRDWLPMGLTALGVAVVAAATGLLLARTLGDSQTGAVIATAALPYALVGGLLLLAGHSPLGDLGGAHLLVGAVALLLASVAGYLGTAELVSVFLGTGVFAGLTALGAACTLVGASGPQAAALVLIAAIQLMPFATTLSLQLGRVPLPQLPQTPRDLLTDRPVPPPEQVFDAVRRADHLLSGLLFGVGLSVTGASALLCARGWFAGVLLAGVVATLLLLRSRSLPRIRHRLSGLVGGGLSLAMVAFAVESHLVTTDRPLLLWYGLLPVAALAVFAGLRYTRRRAGPRLGRLAELCEVLLAIAVVPIAAQVFHLYGLLRGLAG